MGETRARGGFAPTASVSAGNTFHGPTFRLCARGAGPASTSRSRTRTARLGVCALPADTARAWWLELPGASAGSVFVGIRCGSAPTRPGARKETGTPCAASPRTPLAAAGVFFANRPPAGILVRSRAPAPAARAARGKPSRNAGGSAPGRRKAPLDPRAKNPTDPAQDFPCSRRGLARGFAPKVCSRGVTSPPPRPPPWPIVPLPSAFSCLSAATSRSRARRVLLPFSPVAASPSPRPIGSLSSNISRLFSAVLRSLARAARPAQGFPCSPRGLARGFACP